VKALVTGANGHIGSNVVRTLLDAGYDVRALVRRNDKALKGLDVEIVHGDLLDLASLQRACRNIDIVHHLGAYVSIEEAMHPNLFAINVRGTQNLIQASLEVGVQRWIHYSSVHALESPPHGQDVNEQSPLALKGSHLAYDRSKALAEIAVLEAVDNGLDAVILNPVGVVGPNDFGPSRMGSMLLRLAHGTLPGIVHGGFYWVDVRDVAQAGLSATTHGVCGERYIIWGQYVTIPQIADWV